MFTNAQVRVATEFWTTLLFPLHADLTDTDELRRRKRFEKILREFLLQSPRLFEQGIGEITGGLTALGVACDMVGMKLPVQLDHVMQFPHGGVVLFQGQPEHRHYRVLSHLHIAPYHLYNTRTQWNPSVDEVSRLFARDDVYFGLLDLSVIDSWVQRTTQKHFELGYPTILRQWGTQLETLIPSHRRAEINRIGLNGKQLNDARAHYEQPYVEAWTSYARLLSTYNAAIREDALHLVH